jgi:hypothetical protein
VPDEEVYALINDLDRPIGTYLYGRRTRRQTPLPISPWALETGRVRRRGGGRKPLTSADPTLLEDLRALVVGDARGDPVDCSRRHRHEQSDADLAVTPILG